MKAQLEQLKWKQIVALHKHLEGGGIGDYARRNKAAEIELVLGKFQPAQIEAAIQALGANVVQLRPEPEAVADQPEVFNFDVASEVRRILGKPLAELEGEITALVQQAHKPPQIVEKRVEVPVEKIVEKIVERNVSGGSVARVAHSDTAKQVVLFVPKIEVKTAKEVFGIELLAADGSPIKVEVYNDPLAPQQIDKHYVWNREHLHYALSALWRRRNIWAAGPRGTGKTQFFEQLAARTKRSLFRVNFNGATDKTEVLGGDTLKAGEVSYREGVILQGIRRAGALILLDEVGFARAEYLSALHAVLEANGCYTINETGETVAPAQGVVFAAADNSTGHGDATGAYAGLKRVNSAFLDRFSGTVEFDYLSSAVEAKVLRAKTGIHKVAARHITDFMKVCRQKASVGDLAEPPSLRQACYFAEALIDGIALKEAFTITVCAKADPDSRELLRQVFNSSINEFGLQEVLAGRAAEIGGVNETTAEQE